MAELVAVSIVDVPSGNILKQQDIKNFNPIREGVPIASQLTPLEYHCQLNIQDSIKDAKTTGGTTSAPLFTNALTQLYSYCSGNPRVDLDTLKGVLTDSQLRTEQKICGLSKHAINNDDIDKIIGDYSAGKGIARGYISSIIPDTYKWAIHDAALTPKDFQPSIEEIETAASCIDPGGRQKGKKVWPGLNQKLTINLTNFGFADITFEATFTDIDGNYVCRIIIKKGDAVWFNLNVDRRGSILNNTVDGISDYFGGNQVKNEFLNSQNIQRQQQAYNYVLAKELGDTLQVIIAHIMIQITTDADGENHYTNKNLVAFTGDMPFTCRCISLGVPVLLKQSVSAADTSAVLRHYTFYTSEALSDDELKKTILNRKIHIVSAHNLTVKNNINKFLRENLSLFLDLNSSLITEDNKQTIIANIIRPFFIAITDNIDEINTLINTFMNSADITPDDIEKYRANEVIIITATKKGNKYILNILLNSLFISDENDYIKQRLGDDGKRNIGDLIKSFKKPSRRGGKLSGGGDISTTQFKQEILPYICFSFFYKYFTYVGGTVFYPQFLENQIKMFLNGRFMPLRNFEEEYLDLKKRIETDVNENPSNYLSKDQEESREKAETLEEMTENFFKVLERICSEIPDELINFYIDHETIDLCVNLPSEHVARKSTRPHTSFKRRLSHTLPYNLSLDEQNRARIAILNAERLSSIPESSLQPISIRFENLKRKAEEDTNLRPNSEIKRTKKLKEYVYTGIRGGKKHMKTRKIKNKKTRKNKRKGKKTRKNKRKGKKTRKIK